MNGWRAKIGSVQPSNGGIFSYEFYKIAPEGVLLVTTSTNVQALTKSELERAFSQYEQAGRILAYDNVDFIVVGGGPVVALKGLGADREIAQRIQDDTGIPTIHKFTATFEALRKLNVNKVAVVTPFRDEVNAREKNFMELNGFEVVNIKGLQVERNVEISNLPPYAAYRLAKETFRETPHAEGIYISCGRWQTLAYIEALEQDLKVPVVTSCQAAIWAAFSRTGVGGINPQYGELLRTL